MLGPRRYCSFFTWKVWCSWSPRLVHSCLDDLAEWMCSFGAWSARYCSFFAWGIVYTWSPRYAHSYLVDLVELSAH